jgi:uncharacterized protein (TIGR02001 family)
VSCHTSPHQSAFLCDRTPALTLVLRLAGVAALALFSGAARAQVAGNVLVESDYRFRGISLSGENPAAHLSLSYDHPRGWYAGASLAGGVELKPGQQRAAVTGYAGYVRRTQSQGAWEAGAILNRYSGASIYDYGELFAGYIADRWTARMYFSPNYFGSEARTLYAELNGTLPLTPALHGFAHSGVLTRVAGDAPSAVARTRYDARVGLGLRLAEVGVRLAWVGASRASSYSYTAYSAASSYKQRQSTLVLSAEHDF